VADELVDAVAEQPAKGPVTARDDAAGSRTALRRTFEADRATVWESFMAPDYGIHTVWKSLARTAIVVITVHA
jgi:hypothetical protein